MSPMGMSTIEIRSCTYLYSEPTYKYELRSRAMAICLSRAQDSKAISGSLSIEMTLSYSPHRVCGPVKRGDNDTAPLPRLMADTCDMHPGKTGCVSSGYKQRS